MNGAREMDGCVSYPTHDEQAERDREGLAQAEAQAEAEAQWQAYQAREHAEAMEGYQQ